MQAKLRQSLPAFLLVLFVLIANLAIGLQYGLSIRSSELSNLVYFLGVFWGLSWWLINDSQKYEWKWHLGWGNFLYLVGWLLVPLYLFKTRGAKAFLVILFFSGLYIGTYILGIVSGVIISMLRRP
jgi:hypothetical protein